MKRVRLMTLGAAILVTAMQWAAFFSPMLYTQSPPAVGAPIANEVFEGELPVLVVTGHIPS